MLGYPRQSAVASLKRAWAIVCCLAEACYPRQSAVASLKRTKEHLINPIVSRLSTAISRGLIEAAKIAAAFGRPHAGYPRQSAVASLKPCCPSRSCAGSGAGYPRQSAVASLKHAVRCASARTFDLLSTAISRGLIEAVAGRRRPPCQRAVIHGNQPWPH